MKLAAANLALRRKPRLFRRARNCQKSFDLFGFHKYSFEIRPSWAHPGRDRRPSTLRESRSKSAIARKSDKIS